MELTDIEMDELEQILLYIVYPENYDEIPFDSEIAFDILDKVEDENNYRAHLV